MSRPIGIEALLLKASMSWLPSDLAKTIEPASSMYRKKGSNRRVCWLRPPGRTDGNVAPPQGWSSSQLSVPGITHRDVADRDAARDCAGCKAAGPDRAGGWR